MNESSSGHSLGGNGNAASFTADELRQRRMAALGGSAAPAAASGAASAASAAAPTDAAAGGGATPSSTTTGAVDGSISTSNSASANMSASSGTSMSMSTSMSNPASTNISNRPAPVVGFNPVISNDTRDFEEEDAELQAALAMSMERSSNANTSTTAPAPATTNNNNNNNNNNQYLPPTPPPSVVGLVDLQEVGQEEEPEDFVRALPDWYATGEPYQITTFHQVMWDCTLTTDSDKLRWVGQAIDVRESDNDNDSSATMAATTNTNTDNMFTQETMLHAVARTHLPWGLLQQHGGPCGVMAAVQAELLRLLLFGRRRPVTVQTTMAETSTPQMLLDYPTSPNIMPGRQQNISSEFIREALARSIAVILARAALTPPATGEETNTAERKNVVRVVLPTKSDSSCLSWQDLEPWLAPSGNVNSHSSASLSVYTIDLSSSEEQVSSFSMEEKPKRQKTAESKEFLETRVLRLARAVGTFLLLPPKEGRPAPLDSFRRPGGVLLLVMSVVASRGKHVIEKEFDDPIGTKLTSQFGHCAQELMNLLLTGQAVSNVFDNTLIPSGELILRGIQSQPTIGYLSQLESLRYCEVGSYYKSPRFPIWVVGSASHFTVLFGEASSLKESKSDMLLEQCRRAFKGVEGGEEHGFISTVQLGTVMAALDLDVGGDHAVQTLAASLEVSGAGIILWDEFWKVTSRLMTGATLEQVLQGRDGNGFNNEIELPPLLLTEFGETDVAQKPAAATIAAAVPMNHSMVESDEEMARRLAAEWGSDTSGGTGIAALSEAARVASPMEVESAGLSDEELARRLQAEWDAETPGAASSSVAAVNGSPVPIGLDPDDGTAFPATPPREDSKPRAKSPSDTQHNLDFEKYGDSFELYHYNGLRGGLLTPFRVTRLSAEEAVGASIALNRGNQASSHGSGGSDGDLEDVVRTKWPSCMVNWLGKSPPYID
jgi:hypothetical protein